MFASRTLNFLTKIQSPSLPKLIPAPPTYDTARGIGGNGSALTAIYLATALLSEVLTNNAAGAVMYPIAATVGDQLGIPVKAMTIAVMLGASAAWVNPYGYQCNLMVYTAGGYSFKEFAIFGAPFQAYLAVVAALILFHYDQWQTVWIITFTAAASILLLATLWAFLPRRMTLSIEIWLEGRLVSPVLSLVKDILQLFKSKAKSKVNDGGESPAASHHKPIGLASGGATGENITTQFMRLSKRASYALMDGH